MDRRRDTAIELHMRRPLRFETNMLSPLARSLMLACGLLLVLPPGWCCMVPFRACAQEVKDGDAQQPRPCCQHADGASKPSSPRAPEPAPPLPLAKCPCSH